jgi:APA family basic amino acid/polyamine antiporter
VGYLGEKIMYRVPGHPVTTVLFVAICWWVVANTIYRYPQNSLIGFAILLAGVPVYWMWSRKAGSPQRGGDTEPGKHQNPN